MFLACDMFIICAVFLLIHYDGEDAGRGYIDCGFRGDLVPCCDLLLYGKTQEYRSLNIIYNIQTFDISHAQDS